VCVDGIPEFLLPAVIERVPQSCVTARFWRAFCQRLYAAKAMVCRYEFKIGLFATRRRQRLPMSSDFVEIQASSTMRGKVEYLLDDDQSRFWGSDASDIAPIVTLHFGKGGIILTRYSLKAQGHGHRSPRKWYVQGSTDGREWVMIDTQENDLLVGQWAERCFPVEASGIAFRWIRFKFIKLVYGDFWLNSLDFFGQCSR
jgi:hypothetical protein